MNLIPQDTDGDGLADATEDVYKRTNSTWIPMMMGFLMQRNEIMVDLDGDGLSGVRILILTVTPYPMV